MMVTDQMSLTYFVSNTRHQHRCSRRKPKSKEKCNLRNSGLNHIQVDEIFDCMVGLRLVELAVKLNIHMSIQIRD